MQGQIFKKRHMQDNNPNCICDSIKYDPWHLQIQEFFTQIPTHCICNPKKNRPGQMQPEMYFPEVFPQRNSRQQKLIDQQKHQNPLQEQQGQNDIRVDGAQNHRKDKNKKIKKEPHKQIRKDADRNARDNIKNDISKIIIKIDSLKIQNYQQFVENKIRKYDWDLNLCRNQKFMAKIALDFRKQKLQNKLNLEQIKTWVNQQCKKLKNEYKSSQYLYKISYCLQNGFLKIIQAQDFDIALQGIMSIYSTETKNNSAYVWHSSKQGIRQVYELLTKEQNKNEYQLQRYKQYMIEKECWIDQIDWQGKNKKQNSN